MDDVTVERTAEAVWVNDAVACIGRFARNDAVVLPSGERQLAGEPYVESFQGVDPDEVWRRFRASMRTHHGVEIPEDHRPVQA